MAHRTRDAVAVTFWTTSSLGAFTSASTWTATHLVPCTPSRPAENMPRGDRRYWVWVTGPDYYLDDDGSERRDLDPGQGYEPGG